MYAIIKTGGKQHRVAKGDVIDVELLTSFSPGDHIKFEVLFVKDGDKTLIGTPNTANMVVSGEIIGTVKGEKISSLKYKPSHNECRQWGHRQKYTRVKIIEIGASHHSPDHQGG